MFASVLVSRRYLKVSYIRGLQSLLRLICDKLVSVEFPCGLWNGEVDNEGLFIKATLFGKGVSPFVALIVRVGGDPKEGQSVVFPKGI